MAHDICLVVVFNHRFDRNVPVLRALYGARFPHMRFLMPFYTGTDPDVIPVYDSSDTYQGFYAQARERVMDARYSHYLIIGDDVLLHPALSQANLCDELGLGEDDAFFPWLYSYAGFTAVWQHYFPALRRFRTAQRYVKFADQLPTRADAVERFARHGLAVEPFCWGQALGTARGSLTDWLQAAEFTARQLIRGRRELVYPLAMGYSDFLIVPASAMPEFCHLSGIFAAMGLFVEVATPTALALACRRIVTQRDQRWQGGEIWGAASKQSLTERYGSSLTRLQAEFPANTLYVHPIKLSQWRLEDQP